MRVLISTTVLLIVAALGALAFGGFITVWDGDAGEDVFVRRIDSSAAIVFVLSLLALIAAITAFWIRKALWVVSAAGVAAALLTISIRRSVLSDTDTVNDYIATEGGTGGVSSPITRTVRGTITNVDSDIIDLGWAIGAGLLLAAGAVAAWGIWLDHHRG